jgi:hypothetical protein
MLKYSLENVLHPQDELTFALNDIKIDLKISIIFLY